MSIERDIEHLQDQVRELERELWRLRDQTEAAREMAACDECGVVLKNSDAYGEHLCAGRQGR